MENSLRAIDDLLFLSKKDEYQTPWKKQGDSQFEGYGITAECIIEVQCNQRIFFYWIVALVRNIIVAILALPRSRDSAVLLAANVSFAGATLYAYTEQRFEITRILAKLWFGLWSVLATL